MFARYKNQAEKTIWKLNAETKEGVDSEHTNIERWMVKYARCINVKMVGVWDSSTASQGDHWTWSS